MSAAQGILTYHFVKNQDNSVKLSNSLVLEKNMATSVQYVTLPEPALSDLCPAVPLFTKFGSNLDGLGLVSRFKIKDQERMLLH